MVAGWIEKLVQFNIDIKHRAGNEIPHADSLSRINTEDDEIKRLLTLLRWTQSKTVPIMIVKVDS